MNVSILEGYPLSAQSFRGTPFSAQAYACAEAVLSGAFLHIGIVSLDDKGAPYGYCTDESAWRTARRMRTPRTCL